MYQKVQKAHRMDTTLSGALSQRRTDEREEENRRESTTPVEDVRSCKTKNKPTWQSVALVGTQIACRNLDPQHVWCIMSQPVNYSRLFGRQLRTLWLNKLASLPVE